MNRKKTAVITATLGFLLLFSFIPGITQEVQEESQEKEKFFLFKKLDAFKQKRKEAKELREKHLQERKELKERQKTELEEKRKERIEEKKRKKEIEKENKAKSIEFENKLQARQNEIEKAKKTDKQVTILSSKEDPIYIERAEVIKDAKTKYLAMKGIELSYKIKIKNQTPKIINWFSFTWQRSLPFDDTQTFDKITKISKPLVPYEDRIIQYNELDSGREGEIYLVKINTVVFEDGTQWKNTVKF